MSISPLFRFPSSSLDSKLLKFNNSDSSSSVWKSLKLNNSRRTSFQIKANSFDSDSSSSVWKSLKVNNSRRTSFQTKAPSSDSDSDSQLKSQSSRVLDFKDNFFDECKDLIRDSLRKNIIKTLNALDLLAMFQITKYFEALVEKMGIFAPLLAILWIVMKIAAFTHIYQDKKRKDK